VALHGGKLWAERGGMRPRGALRQERAHARRRSDEAAGDGALYPSPATEPEPRGMTFYVTLPVGPE